VIKENALDSTPYWPPKGAPNILLIMTDDQGYGVSGTFGGVIATPALDRVAKTHARGADHRPQPPLGWLRRHRRIVHRVPGP
jgi:hypothetical protein